MNKIIRSLCYFAKDPSPDHSQKLEKLEKNLIDRQFEVQTKRITSPNFDKILELDGKNHDEKLIFGLGSIPLNSLTNLYNKLISSKEIHFNIDLTNAEININQAKILFDLIENRPSLTFNFSYVFNNPPSSPFFPSSHYEKDGFAIGLQPTDLSENCKTLNEWLNKIKDVWNEINELFKGEKDFLGIDSSIAPLFTGKQSLINFIKKIETYFSHSTTTDIYLKITGFLKTENPKPVGLCGIMFPALEDFELAEEYEKGNFAIERNIYLSLHSGLGIDTYPIGIDESPQRVLEILKVVQSLSNKYKKPLSVRFVSDGKTKIGEKSDFQNQYLKEVTIKAL